jgi:choline-glycine betaine transporter
MQKDGNIKLNKWVFFPTILFLLVTVGYSLYDNKAFLTLMNTINDWILSRFGWLFTWSAFSFLIILAIVYFSPLGKFKIGGEEAVPLVGKWKWFSIALCTTIATGILFWGCAEPLYHLHTPPEGLGIGSESTEAATFSMSTMFMHWSFTPYAIYTVSGLSFALSYYNYNRPFRISTLLYPLFGKMEKEGGRAVLDILCLYALVAGMAASLGAGIFALMGGLEIIFGLSKSNFMIALISFAIVGTFITSAVSGLKKGIAVLSKWNAIAFFILAFLVFILGDTSYMLKVGADGMVDYVQHFLSRSTNIGSSLDKAWLDSWTVFYFANWFAWAPIASLFLGRLSVGYRVRDFIHFHILFPALFSCVWMMIFSGSAVAYDVANNGDLYQILQTEGLENVLYTILQSLKFGIPISILALIMIFVSYVTAADSTVSAMSAMSSLGVNPDNPEAPIWIKIVWGSIIGVIAAVMISSAGIDGIRLLCVLGGFPAVFIILAVGIGLLRLVLKSLRKT